MSQTTKQPQPNFLRYLFLGVFLLIIFGILTSTTFITVEPGERGVLFKRFGMGLDKEHIYRPGFHVVAPWNKLFVYDVREKQVDEELTVLSSNGLVISVDVTVRVNPTYSQIGDLHEKFGTNYMQSLVRPEVRSAVRQVIGQFDPEELYSSKREEVQSLIQSGLAEILSKNHIDLKTSLIRGIELPDKVKTAIEEKLQAEQFSLKYEYLLDQERKEAERKVIEARAKAEANRIISASLTDKILRDKGIEATLELANSPNSKVIVIGGGDEGLPLILGGQ